MFPRYSIIVPHYNNPKLLHRLLDSIPVRSDLEIIVVDDNSDPSIVDFSAFPGQQRPEVKLIFDKERGFGGHARNVGLSVATGEWILFADCDDFYTYCFNEVLNECYSIPDDVDLVFFNACSLDSETYTNTNRAKHLNVKIKNYEDGKNQAELMLRYKFGEPWAKMARKSMIDANNIRFEERSIHNDTAYSYLVGYYARRILVNTKAIYCITDRCGSVSNVINETKKLERIDNFATSSQFFKTHSIPVKETWQYSQLYECYRENKVTYKSGVEILLKHGDSMSTIRKELIKVFLKTCIGKIKSLGRRLLRKLGNE